MEPVVIVFCVVLLTSATLGPSLDLISDSDPSARDARTPAVLISASFGLTEKRIKYCLYKTIQVQHFILTFFFIGTKMFQE